MAIRYCDFTNGNDANPGTIGSPKKTLQAIVDISTRADVAAVANTSAQDLVAPITWNTGFVNSGTGFFIIMAYDAGGAITIQRPDELTPRVAATLNGGGTIVQSLSAAPPPTVLVNIKFTNFTTIPVDSNGGGPVTTYGCEITGQTGSTFLRLLRSQDKSISDYIHSNTTTREAYEAGTYTVMLNNYVNHQTSASGVVLIDGGTDFIGNTVVLTAANAYVFNLINDAGLILNNTFIANSSAGQRVLTKANANVYSFRNNMFYKFDGAGSVPLNLTGTFTMHFYGPNAYYDSNAAVIPALGLIGVDFSSLDISASGDPFVDSVGGDYRLTAGALAAGAGIANYNSFPDIGAYQSLSTVTPPSVDANALRANRGCE